MNDPKAFCGLNMQGLCTHSDDVKIENGKNNFIFHF
jgi:hypothetical protein